MSARYLLDTNIVSDLIRNPQGKIRDMIVDREESTVAISVIVAAEIRFGCRKRDSAKLTRQANAIIEALTVLPWESPADECYARIRNDLEVKGESIGPNDLLIAAHCLALGLTLVTANQREFERVKGLKVENWLE
ncbi:type II toxin-antitoxin system VapC family toxin [Synoicihabitans lomoniglobus]|uniref:Ribonuclease VapC n=1 Tax=Synoicihabitans lomoniglobus TaxID=2909285 RepID=A0AAF0I545_9BACT|nr:type II toxin-antitoxin system VapC family toxin [Opitutaceae bacterium LMO-M01]WED67109.1 type II toxin-antitoxin system VapC family toxin [Opitutaceae bacterium LMO-M01]